MTGRPVITGFCHFWRFGGIREGVKVTCKHVLEILKGVPPNGPLSLPPLSGSNPEGLEESGKTVWGDRSAVPLPPRALFNLRQGPSELDRGQTIRLHFLKDPLNVCEQPDPQAFNIFGDTSP
jgi:hypothetical protein